MGWSTTHVDEAPLECVVIVGVSYTERSTKLYRGFCCLHEQRQEQVKIKRKSTSEEVNRSVVLEAGTEYFRRRCAADRIRLRR